MTLLCCVISFTSTSSSSQKSKPPLRHFPLSFSSGGLDCTPSSFLFIVLVCFLEGLMHMRKTNCIYFNSNLILFYINMRQEVFFCLHHIPNFGRANVKRCTFECWVEVYPVSLCLFLCAKKKKRERERRKELKKTKKFHGVYFSGRTFTSVPNRMRMCMDMHAPSYLDALC